MIQYTGQKHYEVLHSLLKDNNILQNYEGAEIGVRHGDTAEYLFRNNPGLHLYLVDPYFPYMDVTNYFFTSEEQEKIKVKAKERIAASVPHFVDYTWIYRDSIFAAEEVSKFIENEDSGRLDFVFIDACHEYKNVKEDIAAWAPLVRKGGLLTGHDFSMDGVRKAVDEFMVANKKEVYHTGPATDVWAIEM